MRYILIALLLFSVYGCKDMGSYDYVPYKDVGMQINLKDAKYYKEHKSTFLFFELRIENDASQDTFFNPAHLKVKTNGIVSEETHYDSLASVMPERQILNKGESSFDLYFVLPSKADLKSIDEFEVLNYGLDQGE